ncbi:MAG: PH domain-containing protein [Thermoleophilia bacterium]|nr:PH domain-containing protein [Thermoleophilia bacterium]
MTGDGHRVVDPSQPLDPRAIGLWTTQARLATAAATAIPGAVAVALLVTGHRTAALVFALGALARGASGAAFSVLWPPRYHARYRWDVLPEGVVVAHGWLWRTVQVVPHSRIQAVDSSSGPMERRAGLASVHLRTASREGSPHIPGLAADVARALAARIAEAAGNEDDAT